jgi:polysaccharide export outer membrane protein
LHKSLPEVRNYLPILFVLTGLILVSPSCSYKKRNILFKTPKEIKSNDAVLILNAKDTSQTVYRHRIKVGDRLAIRFLNNYDIGGAAAQSATASANNENISGADKGYLVNYDSTVILPLIGKTNLVGLTRLEASARLEKEYSKFIVNPIIDINIASLGVTVLGEVARPGKIYVDKENTTLIEVIALAGGISDAGKKYNVKIIRGTEVILVDLRKIEALQSPRIVMQDNDIVYIEPYNIKAATEPAGSISPLATLVLAAMQSILIITQLYIISQR